MNLAELIQLKYPEATIGVNQDILIEDIGEGAFISQWNLAGIACPNAEDLLAWETEFAQAYIYQQNKLTNKPLYDALEAIDLKSIRALRSNDTGRLAELETEAVALRSQLLPAS